MDRLLVTFAGGGEGLWRVDQVTAICGEGLPAVERLAVLEDAAADPAPTASWRLRGVTSNGR